MMKYLQLAFCYRFFTVANLCFATNLAEKTSTHRDQGKVMLTIYNENLALIKENAQSSSIRVKIGWHGGKYRRKCARKLRCCAI